MGSTSEQTMDSASEEEWKLHYAEEIQKYIADNGVSNIKQLFEAKLEDWRKVEVNIGITGESGTGKSSFINAIRGLDDDHEQAAEVGVKETTRYPTCYEHPSNPKIKFTDLPGVGTPTFSALDSYCRETKLDQYDTFLIFSSNRFRKNDQILAQKLRSLGKKFFFVRTKIDDNIRCERRKKSTFNETAVLDEIRNDCVQNLSDLLEKREDVFLISNHDPSRWDFNRLTCAILDVLPTRQKEALSLSLETLSKDLLKRKIAVLRGRIPIVAGLSAASACIPVPGLSIFVDIGLITHELTFYTSQLGIPVEGWKIFLKLQTDTKCQIRQIFQTIACVSSLTVKYVAEAAVEEVTKLLVPILGSVIAGGMSCAATYYMLNEQLNEIGKVAIKVIEEVALSSLEDRLD